MYCLSVVEFGEMLLEVFRKLNNRYILLKREILIKVDTTGAAAGLCVPLVRTLQTISRLLLLEDADAT